MDKIERKRAAKGRIQYIAIASVTYYFLLSITSSCTFFGAVTMKEALYALPVWQGEVLEFGCETCADRKWSS